MMWTRKLIRDCHLYPYHLMETVLSVLVTEPSFPPKVVLSWAAPIASSSIYSRLIDANFSDTHDRHVKTWRRRGFWSLHRADLGFLVINLWYDGNIGDL